MLQFIRTLASLWTLLAVLTVALFPPQRPRDRHEQPRPRTAPPPPHRRSATARRFTVPPPTAVEALPEPVTGRLPEPELLDPEEHSPVRPYVTQHEHHRQEQEEGRRCPACGATVSAPEPHVSPTYGDGIDDVRAELSPLVRQWLAQREENMTGVGQ
ncbi:hypothetical protein FHX37_3536 [Haloactinospora alba]|uniref:Uncharacterized protein n=1 Tax=Haloactinospora alba TaxID=405555 RepID=A0A543NNV3_9ACTN|nr:hypothetical protein [Haloactinospora alba]TQN33514.1 hypothetical protein FHX37_3536 [Haloactinospora alba]